MSHMTIKNIAQLANVSPSAVSIVLNDKPGVSEQTRAHIKSVIAQVNYTPNVSSRRLILKKSFNIFVVIEDTIYPFNNLFYSEATMGIIEKCNEFNYNVILSSINGEFDGCTLKKAIEQKNVDGVIFIQDISPQIWITMQTMDVPFVVLDSHKSSPEYACVRCDYNSAAYAAASYLIKMGHTELGFIGMGSIPDYYLSAFNGFSRALAEINGVYSSAWIQSDAWDEDSAYACTKSILSVEHKPTAVVCAGDLFAISGMLCAADMGLAVPDDISFCGIDNILISHYCAVPLTTVDIDKKDMGIRAVELLLRLMAHGDKQDIIIDTSVIIERKSVSKR